MAEVRLEVTFKLISTERVIVPLAVEAREDSRAAQVEVSLLFDRRMEGQDGEPGGIETIEQSTSGVSGLDGKGCGRTRKLTTKVRLPRAGAAPGLGPWPGSASVGLESEESPLGWW